MVKLSEPKNKLPKGLASLRKIIGKYKESATKKGHIFELDEFQMIHLTQMRCHYCGAIPSRVAYNNSKTRRKWTNGGWYYNGIDRVDNNGGYTLDNVVTCCWKCNNSKGNKDVDEWLEHILTIAEVENGRTQ